MKLPSIQNFHKHTDDTNPIIKDSPITYEMLAKKTIENGGKILSSVSHGWQGRYHICYEVAKKYDLKFIFGTEAYWVKNRLEKDKTNSHLILLAKNRNGFECINEILSMANIDGYLYRPRIDLDLIFNKLPKKDVFITSSCLAGWKYDDIEEIWLKFYNHFQDNFMLEIQMHNTEEQKDINQRILNMHKKYGIKMIVGLDTHFLNRDDKALRDDLLLSGGIKYHESECGWEMDYPTTEEVYNRFIKQGIFTEEQIIQAIDNTNIVLEFDDIDFDRSIKLPTIYKDLTQEEKNDKFKTIINKEFQNFVKKNKIPKEKLKAYIDAIRNETKVILNTNMTEYFLINYEIIKKGVEKGGVITPSARGSAGSFLLNTLFGFSSMDRISSPIKLFPERFLTEDRIKAGSLVDIDFNVNNAKPFIEAQKEILGEDYAFPMIAFGTIKVKSGFKLYARSKNLSFEIANNISKQIDLYTKALSKAKDEEKEHISIYDYVEKEYHNYIKESENYLGIVVDKKVAPCSHILYTANDIKKEIGIIRMINSVTKEVTLCACIEGHVADRFGYMKNDILTVTVLDIIANTYKKINKEIHTTKELSDIVQNNKKVWEIYEKGLTICVNQCESESTTKKVMNYKPKNISELAGFIASIRPSFKSMYPIYESRQPFQYNIKAFDDLIQTEEMKNSFILYQEQLMQTFNFAGFPIDECYSIIKAVAKKNPEKLIKLKKQFIDGFANKIKETEPHLSEEIVLENCNKVWRIIEDSASYSFNASHSLAYTYDSLYCAYLKAYYPFEFYSVILETYSQKGEKDKVKAIINEMKKGFNIDIGKYNFYLNNSEFAIDKENNLILPCLNTVKNIGKNTPKELWYAPKNITNFIDLLVYIKENTSIKKNEIEILIKIDYFENFAYSKKLMHIFEIFNNLYKKNNSEKTKIKKIEKLKEVFNEIKNEDYSIIEKLIFNLEFLGYSNIIIPKAKENSYIVIDKFIEYGKHIMHLYQIKTGKVLKVYMNDFDFDNNKFNNLDILINVDLYQTKMGNLKLNNYSVFYKKNK